MASRYFPMQITWWTRSGNDGYGGDLFNTPTVIYGRWEDKAVVFRNRNNEEVVSKAIVYLDRDVEIGDYLKLGSHAGETDPTINNALEVQGFDKSPDLRNLNNLRKAYL